MKPLPAAKIKKIIGLRKKGLSVKAIAPLIPCSLSTAAKWVKGVPLTRAQQEHLWARSCTGQKAATRAMQQKCAGLRADAREQGRVAARKGDHLHALACALYWAEGKKCRNTVVFANTDPAMIRIFNNFLLDTFNKHPKVEVIFHGDEGNASREDTKKFWSDLLLVTKDSVGIVNNMDKRPRSGKKKNRHEFGMCVLSVFCTNAVQHIYGAIEVYGNTTMKD